MAGFVGERLALVVVLCGASWGGGEEHDNP